MLTLICEVSAPVQWLPAFLVIRLATHLFEPVWPHNLQEGIGLWNLSQERGQDELPSGHEPVLLLPADYSLKDVHACAQAGFKIGLPFEEVYVKLGVSMALCAGILKEIQGEWQGHVTSVLIIFPSSTP